MSLTIDDDSATYAPRFEAFAGEISDYDATELESDPVARSTSLRQGADLVEPDWLVVSGVREVLGALPDREGRSIVEYEFGDLSDEGITDLAEVVRILSDVRSEPVVCVLPDPVTMVVEVFGDEWTELLSTQTFDFLDTLHLASQFLTDVLREFQGDVSGIVVDGTHLPEALDEGLSLDEYALELGALFNLADHYDVSVVVNVPSELHSVSGPLADEFDAVAFESVTESTASELSADSGIVGCSFAASIWEATDTDEFRRQAQRYVERLPSGVGLFTQEIPATVRPEYVREFGDILDESL